MKGERIEVFNRQSLVRVPKERIRSLVRFILRCEKKSKQGVSVLVTDDRRISRYHRNFLNRQGATDVIAFPADAEGYLGDVVVSAQTAKRQARVYCQTTQHELARYVAHGVLHLLGYRDKKPKDHRCMHHRQEELLNRFKGRKRYVGKS
jgi:probable rRNA maturation factor